ncbi:MAG: PASTA domain-containing protein [Elusimicrobiales bacterium]|nr:PASTA domain-containing protein [Elusimicrobiales bacterium]
MSEIKNNKINSDDIPLNYIYVLKIVIAILVVILFSYFSFNMIVSYAIHSRKEVVVPLVVGKSPLTALEEISKLNLAMQISGKEFDSSVPVGYILRQKPQAGIKVREGRIIKVVISQGGDSVFVPNLVGLPLRNAELYIRQKQLVLGQVSEGYSNRFPKGVVISQEPFPDTQVEKNTYVNLLVSAGSPPPGVLLMPDFRQKNIIDFYKWIEENKNVKYKIERDPNSIFPKDTIIAQKPGVDSVVSNDEQIIITVSDNLKQDNKNSILITHQVPKTGSARNIRIVVFTDSGEKEVFNGIKEPGSRIELAIPKESLKKIRIYVNGTLVEEKKID